MKTFVTMIMVMGVSMFLVAPAHADWNPGDPAKYVQLPDLSAARGDHRDRRQRHLAECRHSGAPQPVYPFVKVLADDFPCTTTGPITDIHVWGSWHNDKPNPGTTFHLSIHADVPNRQPTRTVIRGKCCGSRISPQAITLAKPYPSAASCSTTRTQNSIMGQDTQVWQYNFAIPAASAFVQQGTAANPMIYWLDVQAIVPGQEVFGWKTSDPMLSPHFGDDAVFADSTLPLSDPTAHSTARPLPRSSGRT